LPEYARATDSEPFVLPPRWRSAKAKLDPKTVFDFVVDDDAAPGNSGSR
jgi:hypothetical protein